MHQILQQTGSSSTFALSVERMHFHAARSKMLEQSAVLTPIRGIDHHHMGAGFRHPRIFHDSIPLTDNHLGGQQALIRPP
jgi:hypothetical protein